MFLMNEGKNHRAFDCLSRWVASQPQGGFVKYGYIGREDLRVR